MASIICFTHWKVPSAVSVCFTFAILVAKPFKSCIFVEN